MAPNKYIDHPYTVCKAYPWTNVFISFITLALIYIPIIPALIFPKIRNLFQNFSHADIAIFSIETSSKRLENESPFMKPDYPIILRATTLSTEGRSVGNIIWSRRISKSSSEYIPLVVSWG